MPTPEELEALHIDAATEGTSPESTPGQEIANEGFTGVDPVLHDAATAKISTLEAALAIANAEITSLKTSLYDKMSEAASAPQENDPEAESLGDPSDDDDPDAPKEFAELFDDVDEKE